MLREAGAGVTFTAAGAAPVTVTVTGMDMDTPVPVRVMLPTYIPAEPNDEVLSPTERAAGFDWLVLRLAAERTIHD